MNIEFKDFNLILTYLWNRVGKKEFQKLLEIANGCKLHEQYIDEKWKIYQRCPVQFLHNFQKFFDAVCDEIANEEYKG